jgi:hypothetical protein
MIFYFCKKYSIRVCKFSEIVHICEYEDPGTPVNGFWNFIESCVLSMINVVVMEVRREFPPTYCILDSIFFGYSVLSQFSMLRRRVYMGVYLPIN